LVTKTWPLAKGKKQDFELECHLDVIFPFLVSQDHILDPVIHEEILVRSWVYSIGKKSL
jgi:hypothetical protein